MADKEASSAPATLGIDNHVDATVVPRMRDLPFFARNADGSKVENKDLFMFAMATGVRNSVPVSVSSKATGGFFRTSYLSDKQNVLMRAVQMAESDYADLDALRDIRETYELAERYANGGFQILEGDLDQNMGSDEIATTLVKEMDELYEQYMGESAIS